MGGVPASRTIARLAALALALAVAQGHAANRLNGIRLHDAPESTRVVLDTRAAAEFAVFTLDDPPRVVIDLRDTRVSGSFRAPQPDSRVVSRVRTAYRQRVNYRVVLDLAAAATPKSFALEPVGRYGHRLVIDLHPRDRAARQPAPRPPPSRPGARDVVIALDAGHGGEDPGAIGVGGIYEKRVVLAIARSAKRHLDAMQGLRGVLVRGGDYYIPLRERTARARRDEVRADYFVSIHADAFRSSRVRGASVYALSESGASSEAARWLAESENRSDLIGGVGGPVSLSDKDDAVAQVLMDISMGHKRAESIEFGEAVLAALGDVARLHKKRVELAGFAVLKSPDLPAILIETGFLSNPEEARRLATARYQQRLGRAIAAGIRAHLLANPPPDTLLASLGRESAQRYVIRRGDTLSEIAERNRVSMAEIKALNGLGGDGIRVGQVLLIPLPHGGAGGGE